MFVFEGSEQRAAEQLFKTAGVKRGEEENISRYVLSGYLNCAAGYYISVAGLWK